MTTRRQFLQLAGAALATPALSRGALRAGWPARPIRAMIPFAAGSSLDIVGRLVLDPLSTQLGQPVVVENRGGAGGTIGTGMVAKADPDGYSILIQASAHSAAPAAYPNITYDVAKDFVAIIPFGTLPNVTVVAPASGIKTLKELVAKAKAGSVTYASAGVGSATHWAAERIRVAGGFTGVHVPFRGGPEALTEVMTGRVDFTSMGMSSALPLIKDGKLVAARRQHAQALADVARRADHDRSRPAGLRLCLLDGPVRAGQDAAGHRRAAALGDREGAEESQRRGEVRGAGHRADAAVARRIRCADQEGNRNQHRAGQSRGAEIQLRSIDG